MPLAYYVYEIDRVVNIVKIVSQWWYLQSFEDFNINDLSNCTLVYIVRHCLFSNQSISMHWISSAAQELRQ